MDVKKILELSNKISDIEKYKEDIKSFSEDIDKWDENTFYSFCKCDNIAGTGRMFFFKSTIKKLWNENKDEIKQHIQKLKDDINNFDNFKDFIQERTGELQPRPWLAINRMAVAIHPDKLCRTVDPKKLISVAKNLGITQTNNMSWIDLNKAVMDELRSKNTMLDEYTLGSIPWAIYEEECKDQEFANYLEKHKNIILNGAPGTGKTYLAKKIAAKLIGNNLTVDTVHNSEQFEFVQFHPSYDYTDFVEGLRPVEKDNNGKTEIVFERKDGIFKEFCNKALAECKLNSEGKLTSQSKKYVFIIDEINRGEISKIFGELFFSIDPGYRGVKGAVRTQYANVVDNKNEFDKILNPNNDKKGHFYVPENVYIIGTMNDIDRSVESMDFAFRRRFAFYEITADDSKAILNGLIKDNAADQKSIKSKAEKAMHDLNNKIVEQGLTESYQIGGSYFLKLDELDGNFNDLWDIYLNGILYEYFRGEPDAENKLEALKKAYFEAVK